MAQVVIEPGLFTQPPDARLVAGRCDACRESHFPASDVCPYCGGGPVATIAVGATGTLYLSTVVNARPPGYLGPVPYGLGLVDLPEGLRVVSRLVASDLESLRSGIAVRLVVAPLYDDDDGNEVLSWAYAPTSEASS